MRLFHNVLFSASYLLLASDAEHGETLQLHGSGTTNPSKCYWLVMSQMKDQSKVPLQLTYRAVGSSTGQAEFLGANNNYTAYNEFGSGDIPISTEDYNEITAAGKEIVHLPILLGAISVFHSIPDVGDGQLNMSSCLLAKVFRRKIMVWDDAEIMEINPNLKLPYENYPIKVARRVRGSSSTASVTEYLHVSCPDEWPANLVGKTIEWPTDTNQCEGSGGMTNCIRDTPGTIGYIDSGHGHTENLIEIELQNKYGTYLSSREAAEKDGIAAAAVSVPSRADLNFGDVSLLNQDGQFTWPIVAMSYVYVRKDLSFFRSEQEKSLLKYFLRSLYNTDVISQCTQFGFTLAPEPVRKIGLEGIDMLDAGNAIDWTLETSTTPGTAMGDYVFSVKRRTFEEYEREQNGNDIETLQETLSAAMERLQALEGNPAISQRSASNYETVNFTTKHDKRVTASFAMSILCTVLWGAAIVAVVAKMVLHI